MKTLLKIVAGLVVVLVLLLVIGIFNLDRGIKAAVETVGPRLTQSDVTLADVDLSLKTGEGSLRGLVVANPAGFSDANAFSLGEIFLSVEPGSVTTDTIVINSLRIVAPEITYESGKGGTNLSQLQKNISEAAGEDTPASAADDSSEGAAKKLIIRDLKITGAKMSYVNPLLNAKPIELTLPDIQLTGIGEKSNGASAAEVVRQVMVAINKNAANAAANSGALKEAGDQIKKQVEDKLGGFKGLLDKN
ncbi:DUF748 domain-containing protein [Porticoccus sp.]|uniref:DUF748 domain-containing protein n=1 Tax=Porticoccus sp. TaxID=2024853 RepID=UPI003F69D48B